MYLLWLADCASKHNLKTWGSCGPSKSSVMLTMVVVLSWDDANNNDDNEWWDDDDAVVTDDMIEVEWWRW